MDIIIITYSLIATIQCSKKMLCAASENKLINFVVTFEYGVNWQLNKSNWNQRLYCPSTTFLQSFMCLMRWLNVATPILSLTSMNDFDELCSPTWTTKSEGQKFEICIWWKEPDKNEVRPKESSLRNVLADVQSGIIVQRHMMFNPIVNSKPTETNDYDDTRSLVHHSEVEVEAVNPPHWRTTFLHLRVLIPVLEDLSLNRTIRSSVHQWQLIQCSCLMTW